VSELPPDYFSRPVSEVDPEIAQVLEDELRRQESTLEMIASENFVPQAVLECQGSVLTNKYAEGLPGKRYYGGCEFVDVAEELAIARAKELFGAEHANVQPHAGAQANASVYHALLEPGDTVLGMKLDQGGHLTHGMKLNFSGRLYDVVAYGVRREDSFVDMDEVERLAHEHRPKMILAGWSAYPRYLDFAAFREIADAVGAQLFVDMAHFAGLVAAGEHPNPVPHADVVSTTVHKTLGGARGGMILCKEELAKKINSAVFPGQQGGPLMHVIAGKAVALKIAQSEIFRERQRRTRAGAAVLAEELIAGGVNVLTDGTDVHLVMVDLRDSELDGMQAEDRLAEVGITVNRNAVPFDPRPPAVSSGLRVGTPALATRGFQVDDFREVGRVMAEALTAAWSDDVRAELSERTRALAERYPLYPELAPAAV
jgi:glycine hydroxymethyltransferase